MAPIPVQPAAIRHRMLNLIAAAFKTMEYMVFGMTQVRITNVTGTHDNLIIETNDGTHTRIWRVKVEEM